MLPANLFAYFDMIFLSAIFSCFVEQCELLMADEWQINSVGDAARCYGRVSQQMLKCTFYHKQAPSIKLMEVTNYGKVQESIRDWWKPYDI